MKYTVKNADGQLTYGSLEEVKQAYVLGLIEGEDEVLEEGATLPRKASGIPLLATAKKTRVEQGVSNVQRGWLFGALALAIITFYLLWNGYFLVGVVGGFVVTGMLIRVTTLVAQRKRR